MVVKCVHCDTEMDEHGRCPEGCPPNAGTVVEE